MVRLLVTTVVRSCPDRNNGFVYEIDWNHKRIVHQQLIPSPEIVELGPRGGARGARGVVSHNGYFYVANFNTVFVFNEYWQLENEISHPLFNGLHEIDVNSDGLWVTSTGIDAVLKVDWSGNLLRYFPLSEMEGIVTDESSTSRAINISADYRHVLFANDQLVTHVNSLKLYQGRPYIGINKQGVILGLEPFDRIIQPIDLSGFHNGSRISDDYCVVNSSLEKKLLCFDIHSGDTCFEFDWSTDLDGYNYSQTRLLERVFNNRDVSPEVARAGWTRGLAMIEPLRFLVGVSPAMVVEIDLAEHSVIDLFQISENVCEAVHGLTIIDP